MSEPEYLGLAGCGAASERGVTGGACLSRATSGVKIHGLPGNHQFSNQTGMADMSPHDAETLVSGTTCFLAAWQAFRATFREGGVCVRREVFRALENGI